MIRPSRTGPPGWNDGDLLVEAGQELAHAGSAAADSGPTSGHPLPSRPGHGLWLVRQVADRMRILSGARGTRATVAFDLPARRKGQGCPQA